MDITTFDDLLLAARQQPEPQRLLLVFAGASLPADASAQQRADFEAGEGGELAPLMCVDKDPHALAGFADLAAEAATLGPPWVLLFAAALAGRAPLPPSDAEVETALQQMVEAVRHGDVTRYAPFDSAGQAVQLV
ncbi:MAG: ribonucleotide reductase subunit alpha [Rubrivivax sp.]|nr:ribonucleotide reductase subunit alpha [Rubrivivax sp.]